MRQQVKATVTLTFDADATLSTSQLQDMIHSALEPIADLLGEEGVGDPLILMWWGLAPVVEEAAIYGNA